MTDLDDAHHEREVLRGLVAKLTSTGDLWRSEAGQTFVFPAGVPVEITDAEADVLARMAQFFPGVVVVASDDPNDDLLGDQPLTELVPDFASDTHPATSAPARGQHDDQEAGDTRARLDAYSEPRDIGLRAASPNDPPARTAGDHHH
jgi:hypothetical protein